MPATFKAILKDTARADGTHLILIRITKDRKIKKVSAGIYIKLKDWNPKATYEKANWVRSDNRQFKVYNTAIRNLIDEARSLALQDRHLSAEQLRGQLKGESVEPPAQGDFLEYFAREVERRKGNGHPRTVDRLQSILHQLQQYKPDGLPFDQVNVAFIRDYFHHLKTHYKNTDETAAKKMGEIHTILKLAILERKIPIEDNPFLRIKFRYTKKKKARLTEEQVRQLERMPLIGIMANARNIFLMQYYCFGARINDMLELRWEKNIIPERIIYTMRKSRGAKSKSIKRHALIDAILTHYHKPGQKEGYVFPYLKEDEQEEQLGLRGFLDKIEHYTRLINQQLHNIQQQAGIPVKLTTHIARHSFASIARTKLKGNIAAIQGLLDHESSQTTGGYLSRLSEEENDEAAAAIYGIYNE